MKALTMKKALRTLFVTSVAFATSVAIGGQALAQPAPACAFTAESDPMIGEDFTGTATLTNTGDAPGFQPAFEITAAPGLTLTGASFQGLPATIVEVGVFAGGPLTNPVTGATTAGTNGETLYFLTLPISSQPGGGPAFTVDLTFAQNGTVVGTDYALAGSCQFAFGTDASNNNGADPVLTATGGSVDVTPVFAKFKKIARQIGASIMIQGESFPASWELIIDVADGRTLETVNIAEAIPDGFIITAFSSANGNATLTAPAAPTFPLAAGTDLAIAVTNVVGTAGTDDETVIIEGYFGEFEDDGTTPLLDPCTGASVPRVNSATFSNVASAPDTQDDVTEEFPTVVVAWAIIETIDNQSRPGETPRPGDTLSMDLDIVVSDYFSFVGNSVASVLNDGLTYNADATPADIGNTDNTTSWTVDFALPDLVGPVVRDAQEITYTMDVDEYYNDNTAGEPPVLLGQTILTTHSLTGTPDTGCGVERTDTEAVGPLDDNVPLATGSLTKSIYAVNGNTADTDPELDPTDMVTYRLRLVATHGDATDTVLSDYFPLPLHLISNISTAAGAPFDGGTHPIQFGPDHATDGSGAALPVGTVPAPSSVDFSDINNGVDITFGPIETSPTTPVVLDILITIPVEVCLYADIKAFTNIGLATFNGGVNTTAFGLTNVSVRQADIVLHHGAVAIDGDNAAAGLTAAPGLDPSNIAVTNATLAAIPVEANAIGDAGDVVTFAAVIENTSDHTAFDLGFELMVQAPDYINRTFVGATDGDGDPVVLSTDPLTGEAIIPTLPGSDDRVEVGDSIIVIIYTAELSGAVVGGGLLQTVARLQRGATTAAGTGTTCTPVPVIVNTAQTVVPSLVVSKARTGGDNPVAIRCGVQEYTVTVTIPEGTHPSFSFSDVVQPDHLTVTQITSATASPGLTFDAGAFAPVVAAGGVSIQWSDASVVNTNRDNGVAETLTVVYEAIVRNTPQVNRGDALGNTARVEWGVNRSSTATTTGLIVSEPTLQMAPASISPSPADAGDTVTVSITIQHTGASNQDAFDAHWFMTLPPEATNLSNFTVTGLAPTTQTVTLTNADLTWGTFADGATSTISYTFDVVPDVAFGASANVTGDVNWTGCAGVPLPIVGVPDSVERTGASIPSQNDYFASAGLSLAIRRPAPTKTLVGTQTTFAIGEEFEYQLQLTIPEGDSATLTARDNIPFGLVYVGEVSGSFSNPGNVQCGGSACTAPSVSTDASGVDYTWTGLSNPPNTDSEVFTWRIRVRPDNNGVVGQGTTLTNGFASGGVSVVAQTVTVVEPNLSVGVTSGPANVDAGDTVTYTFTVNNSGLGTAHDTVLDATLASLVAAGTATVTAGTCTVGVTNPNSAGVQATLSAIAPGETCVFTIAATVPANVSPGQPLGATTANMTWTSLPGVNANERTGDNPAGNIDDYASSGSAAAVTVPDASVAKTLVSTSSTATGANAGGPGETMVFNLAVTMPQGQADLVLTDTLPAGLTIQSVAIDALGNFTVANNPPTFAGGVMDLGSVTLAATGTSASETLTIAVTTVAGAPQLVDANNAVALTVDGAAEDTATLAVDFVNPGPVVSLGATDTTPQGGVNTTVTATVTNTGDGPVCDSDVTITVPAGLVLRDPATDGLDNDLSGSADEAAEAAFATSVNTLAIPVVGCLAAGESRGYPFVIVAPLGGSAPADIAATLGSYQSLPAADGGGVAVDPNTDGIDTNGVAGIDTAGDDTASLEIAPDTSPLPADDAVTTLEGTPVTVDVLANDTGLGITFNGVTTQPKSGNVVVNGDGTLTYTPNPGFVGLDTFTYEVCDTNNNCATSVVTIDVTPTDRGPVANDDSRKTGVDTDVTVAVLDNDEDPEGGVLSIVTTGNPLNGAVTDNGDGTVTYTPAAGFTGTDTFDYTVVDEEGNEATATVTIDVTDANANPVAVDDTATTPEDTAVVIDVDDNDTDADTDSLTVGTIVQPANGTVADNGDGTVTYTPDPDFTGDDTFVYTTCDASGCDDATVTVTVSPEDDGPIALDDRAVTPTDTPVTIPASANDIEPDGEDLTTTVTVPPANGSVVETSPGVFEYTPNTGFTGRDTFAYEVCDPQANCDVAFVFVDVGQTNTAPDVSDDSETVPADVATTFDIGTNDAGDADGDTLYLQAFTSPQNGTVTIDFVSGEATYTPDAGYAGPDFFTYTVCDEHGACDTARVDLTVVGNDGPDAQPDEATTDEDTAVVIAVAANDSDPEGQALTVTGLPTAPANGTAVVNADGTVTYTPNANFNGVDTFEYTVCDESNACETETVTVTVLPVNDPPVPNDDGVAVPADATTTLDVLGNDSDPDGDDLTVLANSEPANGSITVNGDGSIDYTPDPGFVGTDTFTYLACDSSNLCEQATVTITVGGANSPPDAVDDADTTTEETAVTIDVIGNDTDPDSDIPVVASVTLPSNGTAVDNGDGTITYTPNPGFTGTDTFRYTACDPSGACDVAEVTVDVSGINDGPSAVDDRVATPADTPTTVTPASNDTDPDGDTLTVTAVTQPDNGTAVLNPDGTVTYTPATGFTGPDTFTYTVCDPSGLCDGAEITVDVEVPVNEPPVAVDDIATADTATPEVITVLANDTDPETDTLFVASATKPANGTVSIGTDGTITYTSDAGFEGVDTFTYVACDPGGNCDAAEVVVTVGPPVNAPPVGGDDEGLTDEDTAVTLNVLANDTDADGETLTVTGATTPANGTVVVNADGTITYTPNPGFNGTDTFTYEVCDPSSVCDTVDVSVEVTPANDAPVAVDDAWTVPADADTILAVTDNDSDPEGEPLTLLPTSSPAHGTLANNGDGTLTYTPEAGYVGTDTFTYTVCDPNGACDSATVTLDVGGTNANPVAVDDSGTTSEDTAVLIDIATNDTDADAGDTLTVTSISAPANGTVTDNGDGTVTYLPNPQFSGNDTFTYTTCDGAGGCDTATVIVDVTPVDDPPVAIDDVTATDVGIPVTFDPTTNDIEPDGDDLLVTSVTQPANGTATVNADGTVTYTPNDAFTGVDTFTYSACDANGCDSATVTVFVEPAANEAPTATDDAETTALDTPVSIGILANDSDPEGGTLSVTELVDPVNGTVVLNGDGTVTYTPDAGYEGPDSFVYEICDDHGQCDRATVNLTVGDANAAPVGGDDEGETPEGTAVTLNVLANDGDPDGDTLTVNTVSTPGNGTATINTDGTIVYTPNPGFTGVDTFTYEVCDDANECDTVVVTVNVRDEAMAPVAVDDAWSVPADATTPLAVLDNDSDADGDALIVKQVTVAPANGTATVNADGGVDYTPNAGFSGTDTFTYEACDPSGLCDTAVVTVDVGSDNSNPDAVDDTATTPAGTAVVVDFAVNDTDAEGDTLTLAAVTAPSNGSVVDNGDGTMTYTPNANFVGTDTFTYTVCDGNGGCDTATVTVDITGGVDAAPIAVDDVETTLVDTPVMVDVLGNDVELGGETLIIASLTQPANGTVSVNSDGTAEYTPAAGFTGVDTFEYTTCDPAGQCATASVTVYVDAAANEAPVAQDDSAETTGDPVNIAVLANDTDPEAGTLAVTEVTQPKYGTVTLNADGTVTYTPGGELGDNVDTFEYEICDDHGQCDRAIVTINANVAPLGTDDEAQTPRDTPVHIVVLANDVDADGDDLTVNGIIEDPANGDVVVEDDGTVTYTPNPGFTGIDTFTYEVCDPRNFCDEVVVVVEVLDSPAAPQPLGDSASTPQDTAVVIAVLDNDKDPNGDALTVTATNGPENGTVVIEDDGSITYTPNDGFTGSDTFEYQVCDAGGLCGQTTVFVEVGVDNAPPVAVDDADTTPADTAVTVDVVANDSDPDGDATTVASAGQPDNGTTVVNADGTVTYTPDTGFTGDDSFVYTLCDAPGDCTTATVTITVDAPVNGSDRAPVAVDDIVCASTTDPTVVDALANDVDFDGDDITVVAVLAARRGTAVLESNGTITYTPPADAAAGEWDVFGYEITDGNGHIVAARVRIYLTDGSGAPVVVDDEFTVGFDAATTLDVLTNDTDPDGDTLVVVGFTDGADGVVTLAADGSLVYTPKAGFFGIDTITYQVSDGNCGISYGVVVLNVGDADGDGLSDADEAARGTDPNDDDSDNDGISDFDEVNATGPLAGFEPTDPMDSDTDDDGINDGDEANGTGPLTAPTDPNNPDTDADGIRDGTEAGVDVPVPGGVSDGNGLAFDGTDVDSANWQPDQDPTTTTDPTDNDSDDDTLLDGEEDTNGDGATVNIIGDSTNDGSGETDPNNNDTDGDTLSDGDEVNVHSSNPLDTDTDNGTLGDEFEIQGDKDILDPADDVDDLDSDGDGLLDSEELVLMTDPNNPDTDNDGLSDGAEVNTHKTDPLKADTDGGGINDGEEVTQGTDPLDPSDDGRVLLHGGGACEAGGTPVDSLPIGLALLMLAFLAVLRRREA